ENKIGSFGIFRGSVAISELQMIDPGLLGEEFCLVATAFLTPRASGIAAPIERGARSVEITAVDELEGVLSDRSEFRPVVTQPCRLSAQAEGPGGCDFKACKDLGVRHTDSAELGENRLQRCDGNPFRFRNADELFLKDATNPFLVETQGDRTIRYGFGRD